MRAHQTTPNNSTGEIPNVLATSPSFVAPTRSLENVAELTQHIALAHYLMRQKQWKMRSEDKEEPTLYSPGDCMVREPPKQKGRECKATA